MKVLQINQVYKYGSTGRIVNDLKMAAAQESIEMYVAYGYPTAINIVGNEENVLCLQPKPLVRKLNILRTRLFDHHGFYNEAETRKLIKWMNEIKPDIIHLHNIHSHYVNIKMLFEYIKCGRIPVIWTLHDCWPFTGHCAYFDYAHCNKWKFGCHTCPSLREYPSTWFFDRSSRNYKDKKNIFTGVENLTFVSPSQWLCDIQQQSFLKDRRCIVINNGIDIRIFKPTENKARDSYGIIDKKMILAVAARLALRKGRKYLLELPDYLNEDEILVVVGLSKGQEQLFPVNNKVICIHRTKTADELISWYSAADVFINPTLEDNFPTTNIEALACGTPVVTFQTGGSVEAVLDNEEIEEENGIRYTSVGAVVPKGDMEALVCAIRRIVRNGKNFYTKNCKEKAKKNYEKVTQYNKYIKLYHQIINK